ncbi:oxidoreductase [Microbacterium mangrovi]|uniref:Oxidoreductase n=1 Tax=Microbacterium mangrovi TaxID=1348253 RepID=A0A0B2A278_9MICO|nr:Gfo/Idh/MocA family oxidoreductase [Microbacterium mangrovi]KHK95894.1 oxidoreductase [Microbacterium mangrovi]
MPDAIRAGFAGGGFMGAVHTRAARAAGADLVAITSSSAARASRAAEELGVRTGAATVGEVVAASDVVHVCTPNEQHAAQALAVIAAGRHVICEKPLATTAADARALVRAAADAGVVGAVPFVYRFHPMVREARALVASGAVGTVLTVDAAYLQDWMLLPTDGNWRAHSGGGASRAFADIGSHLCDLAEFVTADRIVRLSARTRTVFAERDGEPVRNEDLAALLVEFDSGALGTLLVSQMAAGRKNALTLEVHGSNETVRFEQERADELWIGRRDASQLRLRDAATLQPDAARLSIVPSGHPMGYQDAFNAFVRDAYAAMRGETPDGLPTFADGLRAAVLTEAVLASAAARGAWTETPMENLA